MTKILISRAIRIFKILILSPCQKTRMLESSVQRSLYILESRERGEGQDSKDSNILIGQGLRARVHARGLA